MQKMWTCLKCGAVFTIASPDTRTVTMSACDPAQWQQLCRDPDAAKSFVWTKCEEVAKAVADLRA
jgi:hypothetical protein